ncbi:hypothetical protein [Ruminococcus sp.]|nr:hypothetical protein [Ruminococcus sp.]MDD6990180.1 hypothetical protein [Ruminococcus sp.]MDY6202890.1 hypothetical protein [Ruminococcus sp.]
MKIYTVDDISRFSQDVAKVEANSPLEAVKKHIPIVRFQGIMTTQGILL